MATRRYSLTAGNSFKDVVEGVGAATVAGNVEVTVDFGVASLSGQEGKQRALMLLEIIEDYIVTHGWPPA